MTISNSSPTGSRRQQRKAISIDPHKHPVYYRATQVGCSAPCYQRPPLTVGMRVAVLENRNEFTERIPEPEFHEAIVEKIGDGVDPLVTFRFVNHPSVLLAGMNQIAQYCVILKGRSRKPRKSH